MARITLLASLLIFTFVSFFISTHKNAFGWDEFVKTNELFAVGTMDGESESYLFKIDPLSGELTMIGDTGLNNCTGLDFTPDDKLKVFCTLREGSELLTTTNHELLAVTAEADIDDGTGLWAVPHGLSNYISDITIDDQGVLFSYENLETDNLHRHELENDFEGVFVGEPDIDSNNVGLAAWGDSDIKAVANVDDQLWLFTIDAKTAETTPTKQLTLAGLGLQGAQNISTRAEAAGIHAASMDSIKLFGGRGFGFGAASRAGIYAFDEEDSEFAGLFFTESGPIAIESDIRFIPLSTEIALIDVETGFVDYVVQLQDEGYDIDAIAVRPIPQRQVPTLSEWGGIILAALMLIGTLIYLRRNGVPAV